MSQLTNEDYKDILNYYNQPIPKSKRLLKINAEKILSEKLCKCIKKVDPENEAKSIGICTKTIINSKGYTRGNFKCKNKQSITLSKKRKANKTMKIKKIKKG
jgi:hypothetical protein